MQLGVALAPALFRLLVTSPGGEGDVSEELERLDDAADVDCDTWRSCKQLLEMKPEEVRPVLSLGGRMCGLCVDW